MTAAAVAARILAELAALCVAVERLDGGPNAPTRPPADTARRTAEVVNAARALVRANGARW